MTDAQTKIYLGGFILAPALVLLAMITLFSIDLVVLLTILLLFSFGVVFGPAFLGEDDS